MIAVLDASAALGWILPDETPVLLTIDETSRLHVPSVFAYEVAQAMQKAARRDRLTRDGALESLEIFEAFPIQIHPPDPGGVRAAWNFANARNVNAYDGAYLVLAMTLNLPLVTLDGKLADAARGTGVTVFGA